MLNFSQLRNAVSIHYAVRIFIGIAIIELLMHDYRSISPLWAIISLIVVAEPQIKIAWMSFVARFINTIIGCMVGLFFLLVFGLYATLLPIAASVAALLSIWLTRMQQGWRIGPITVALIMSAGMTESSTHDAVKLALDRTMAILLGSVVALVVTWCMSLVWMPRETEGK